MPKGKAISDMHIHMCKKTWDEVPLIMDVPQVAVLLKLHPNTITKLCRAGQLKGRKFGKEWRITKESVMAIMGVS